MAYNPQPFVATPSGSAEDAPSGAKPIALYGVEGGGEAGPVTWASVTGKPATFPPAAHTHTIEDVTELSGALEELSVYIDSVQNGHDALITDLTNRIEALETAAG